MSFWPFRSPQAKSPTPTSDLPATPPGLPADSPGDNSQNNSQNNGGFFSPSAPPLPPELSEPGQVPGSTPRTKPRRHQIGAVGLEPPDPLTSKPLPLVYRGEDGKFVVDKEALLALRSVKGAVGVVAVCGRARQGKSFILNQILGQTSGFQVGPTHRPCTKGLWIWSSPIRCTAPDGSVYHLLLLDSEGIDAYDQTGTYSTQIFSLAVLLSSLFVFNQMGGIDESSLDKLSLVTQVVRQIQVRAAAGGGLPAASPNATPGRTQQRAQAAQWAAVSAGSAARDLGQFSPVFFWLLRDFYFDLMEDGRRISPKDYLETALQPVAGSSDTVRAKNEIRESIRELFPDRDCFALVRPLNEEKELQRLDQVPPERLRPEFRLGVDAVVRAVLERARPKRVGSAVMTGAILAGLTQVYVEAINKGAVPAILNSWLSVEEQECHRAYDKAVAAYHAALGSPADEEALRRVQFRAMQAAERVFGEEAFGTGQKRQEWEDRLKADLAKSAEDTAQKMAMAAQLQCTSAVESMQRRLQETARQPGVTHAGLLQVVEELAREYDSKTSGSAKWRHLVSFLQSSALGLLNDVAQRTIDAANASAAAAAKDRAAADQRAEAAAVHARKLDAATEDWKNRHDAAAGQMAAAQNRCTGLELERDRLRVEVETQRREIARVRDQAEGAREEARRKEEEKQLARRDAEAAVKQLHQQLTAALQRAVAAETEAGLWKGKHDAVVAASKGQGEQWAEERRRREAAWVEETQKMEATFSAKLKEKDEEVGRLRAQLERESRELAQTQVQLQEQGGALEAAQRQVAELRETVRGMEEELKQTATAAGSASRDAKAAKGEKHAIEEALRRATQRHQHMEAAMQAAELAARREAELARQASARAESAQRDLERAAEDVRTAQVTVQSALARAEASEKEAAELRVQVERLRLQQEEAERDVKRQEREREADLAAAREEGLREGRGSAALEAESRVGGERESWRREMDVLRKHIEEKEAETARLCAEIVSLKAREEGAKKAVLLREDREREARAEVQRLQKEVEGLRAELANRPLRVVSEGGEEQEAQGKEQAAEEPKRKRRRRAVQDGASESSMSVDYESAEERAEGSGRGNDGAESMARKSTEGGGVAEGGAAAALGFEVGSPYSASPAASPAGPAFVGPVPTFSPGASPSRGGAGRGKMRKAHRGGGRAGGMGTSSSAATAANFGAGAGAVDAGRKAKALAMTKNALKEELTMSGFGHLVIEYKNATKEELADFYCRYVQE